MTKVKEVKRFTFMANYLISELQIVLVMLTFQQDARSYLRFLKDILNKRSSRSVDSHQVVHLLQENNLCSRFRLMRFEFKYN